MSFRVSCPVLLVPLTHEALGRRVRGWSLPRLHKRSWPLHTVAAEGPLSPRVPTQEFQSEDGLALSACEQYWCEAARSIPCWTAFGCPEPPSLAMPERVESSNTRRARLGECRLSQDAEHFVVNVAVCLSGPLCVAGLGGCRQTSPPRYRFDRGCRRHYRCSSLLEARAAIWRGEREYSVSVSQADWNGFDHFRGLP